MKNGVTYVNKAKERTLIIQLIHFFLLVKWELELKMYRTQVWRSLQIGGIGWLWFNLMCQIVPAVTFLALSMFTGGSQTTVGCLRQWKKTGKKLVIGNTNPSNFYDFRSCCISSGIKGELNESYYEVKAALFFWTNLVVCLQLGACFSAQQTLNILWARVKDIVCFFIWHTRLLPA
jgi:hypothetical protein